MTIKLYRDDGVNWAWYNAEYTGEYGETEVAVTFRLHHGEDEDLFYDKIRDMPDVVNEGPGTSCPIPWVPYSYVRNAIRESSSEGLNQFLDKLGMAPDNFTLACPCNSRKVYSYK